MAIANKKSYWSDTNKRQSSDLSTYMKSGGKDKIRIKNLKSDIKYSAGMSKSKALAKAKK